MLFTIYFVSFAGDNIKYYLAAAYNCVFGVGLGSRAALRQLSAYRNRLVKGCKISLLFTACNHGDFVAFLDFADCKSVAFNDILGNLRKSRHPKFLRIFGNVCEMFFQF